jgi:diguanylate cyclase (GGDEF)-like protein
MSVRRRRSDRDPGLLVYTAVTIAAGLAAFAWTAATYPISPDISLTTAGGREGILLGLVFWVSIGLLGGTRVDRLHGHGALTFHIPFIVAAMAIGGPTAGAIVAMVSTIERREFREMPWYGAVSNHAHMTLAAVVGGVVLVTARDVLSRTAGGDPQAVGLVSLVLGSLVFAVVTTALAAGTVILRDRLTVGEALRVYDTSFRMTSASEVVVGWVLAVTYATVGWWASLICAMLVLAIWQGHDAREMARYDPLTLLLSRTGFDARLAETMLSAERKGHGFSVIAIDLDGFKRVNDRLGHAAGDEVIREVGARLRSGIRLTDAGVRRGGDEYGILLADVGDRPTAQRIAERLRESVMRPIRIGGKTVTVGASFGLFVIEPDASIPLIDAIHRRSDDLMYQAKRKKLGLVVDIEAGEGTAPA